MRYLLIAVVLLLNPSISAAAIICETVESECLESGVSVPLPSGGTATDGEACGSYREVRECKSDTLISDCSTADTEGCQLAQTETIDFNSDGTPAAFEQTWICEDIASHSCDPETITVEELENDDFCRPSETVCDVEIGGICAEETTTYVCQEPTEACGVEQGGDTTCSLDGVQCISSASEPYGCLTQEYTYQCSETTEYCVRSEISNSCTGDMAQGLDSHAEDSNAQALSDLAGGMQVARAVENSISGTPPKIFGGSAVHCTRDILGSNGIGDDCCDPNIDTGDGTILSQCSTTDMKSARARKADRAVYVGSVDFVRNEIDLAFTSFCSVTEKKRQYYCAFDSMLARIVQEQGRAQLARYASQSQPSGEEVIAFPYLDANDGQTNTLPIAGRTFSVESYPAACESQTSEENSQCPDGLYLKVKLEGRGESWERRVDVLGSDSVSLSKDTALFPGRFGTYCDMDSDHDAFGRCEIQVKTWGSDSGEIMVPVTLSKNRFANVTGWSETVIGGDDWEFAMYQNSYSGAAISDDTPVRFRYRQGESVDWSEVSLPSPLSPDADFTIDGRIPVFGECRNGQCRYTLRIPMQPRRKSFVSAYWTQEGGCEQRYSLNCSGFSMSEFQMLDIGKMDLSEFEASISSEVSSDVPDSANYESTAMSGANDAAAVANTGSTNDIDPGKTKPGSTYYSASLEDGQIIEQVEAVAYATTEWPRNGSGNSVSSARVNWGDGSSSVMTRSGYRFRATHDYSGPGKYDVTVTQTMPDGTQHTKILQLIVEDSNNPIPGLGGAPF